jgi:hypothetical protein
MLMNTKKKLTRTFNSSRVTKIIEFTFMYY